MECHESFIIAHWKMERFAKDGKIWLEKLQNGALPSLDKKDLKDHC